MRPARIELATLGLGVPCSIQFELRARTLFCLFLLILYHSTRTTTLRLTFNGAGCAEPRAFKTRPPISVLSAF